MAQWPPGAVGRPHAQLASRDHPRPRETVLADLRRETGSLRELAALMGRSPSTISRELRRGADAAGRYRPSEAHRRALGRRRVHRPGRLARDAELRDWVTGRLRAR
jgi:IS30 family transposase